MILDLYFLGISYILVYVGAISILFLFILMLINIRVSELHTEGRNSIPLALVLIILINSCLESTLPYCTHIINTLGDITKNVYNYVSDLFGMIEFSLANATLKDNLQHYLSRIDNNS